MEEVDYLKSSTFIRNYLIADLRFLVENRKYIFAFVLMGQIIEFLGAHFDKKPLKTSSQSQKRFSKALNILMGNKYREINKDHWFYQKYRNQLTHSFTVSNEIALYNKAKLPVGYKHLQNKNKQIIIVAEDLYNDVILACERLIEKLVNRPELEKKIPKSYLNNRLG
jgi:hypothetical protein